MPDNSGALGPPSKKLLAFAYCLLVGLPVVVLIVWQFHLPAVRAVFDAQTPMNSLTALSFIALGLHPRPRGSSQIGVRPAIGDVEVAA
jgi:hypothetical protein